ncbi:MAG: hypothetical protein PVG98_11480 [Chromatiales bacterium]|jgi:hypothetical protein
MSDLTPAPAPDEPGAPGPSGWWGSFKLEAGESVLWELGDTRFAVQRRHKEWVVSRWPREGGERRDWHVQTRRTALGDPEGDRERFVFARTRPDLEIRPALADRSIVSRPADPFFLQPGEETTIYVSSPLWAVIRVHGVAVPLKELALADLSDTWFGPSTLEGELCYATRTSARLSLDEIPHRVFRAVTPVRLENRAGTALPLDRLNLPVPFLGLYHRAGGDLWTEQISLVREEDGDMAALKIHPGSPRALGDATRIAEPRRRTDAGALVRAFGALFG